MSASKHVSLSFMTVALVMISLPALAGPEIKRAGAVEMAPPMPLFKDAGSSPVVQDTRRQGGQTLRCWQEGRLLYEGSGFRGTVSGGSVAVNVPRNGDSDITVLDLKQGLCILTAN